MPSYLNLSTAKSFLGITVTTYDAALELILSGVEQAVETFVGRGPLARASRVLYLSTSGEAEITLGPIPLLSVDDLVSVYEDRGGYWGQGADAFAAATLLTKGTNYAVMLEEGTNRCRLRRLGTVWPYEARHPVGYLSSLRGECPGCLKITATLGFTSSAPADVIAACYAEAAARWKMIRAGGLGVVTSESVAGASASITLFPFEFVKGTPFVTPLLAGAAKMYRRIPVGR